MLFGWSFDDPRGWLELALIEKCEWDVVAALLHRCWSWHIKKNGKLLKAGFEVGE